MTKCGLCQKERFRQQIVCWLLTKQNKMLYWWARERKMSVTHWALIIENLLKRKNYCFGLGKKEIYRHQVVRWFVYRNTQTQTASLPFKKGQNAVLVWKKDVGNRLCIDYWKFDKTEQNAVLVRKKDVGSTLGVDYWNFVYRTDHCLGEKERCQHQVMRWLLKIWLILKTFKLWYYFTMEMPYVCPNKNKVCQRWKVEIRLRFRFLQSRSRRPLVQFPNYA